MLRGVIAVLLGLLLLGCGQKGDLYLPAGAESASQQVDQ